MLSVLHMLKQDEEHFSREGFQVCQSVRLPRFSTAEAIMPSMCGSLGFEKDSQWQLTVSGYQMLTPSKSQVLHAETNWRPRKKIPT